jgi:ELWxxDGT repeat protein
LWEWNGSTAVELSVPDADTSGLGLQPGNLTDLNGVALFSGVDTGGHTSLFTTAGELTGITDIHGVAISDLDPRFLTLFGSEVLFNGTDSTGAQGLWETNGTAAGTHEIFAGAGDPIGLDPSNFEVFNGQVLFSGRDGSGDQQLWETDGEVGGTTQVTGINNVSASGLAPFDLTTATVNPPPTGSLLWQNNTSGQGSIWELSGSVLVGGGPVSPNPGPSWHAVGTADFFGGGSSDIL